MRDHSQSRSTPHRQQQPAQPLHPRDDYTRPNVWSRDTESHGSFRSPHVPLQPSQSTSQRARQDLPHSYRGGNTQPSSTSANFNERGYSQGSAPFSSRTASGSAVDDYPKRSSRYARIGSDSPDFLPRRQLQSASATESVAANSTVSTGGFTGFHGSSTNPGVDSTSMYKNRNAYSGSSARNQDKDTHIRKERFGNTGYRGGPDRDTAYGASPRFGEGNGSWQRSATNQGSGRDNDERWLLSYKRDRPARFDRDLDRPPASPYSRGYFRPREEGFRLYYGERDSYSSRGPRDYYPSKIRSPSHRSPGEYPSGRPGASLTSYTPYDRRAGYGRPPPPDLALSNGRPSSPTGTMYRKPLKTPPTLMGSMGAHINRQSSREYDDTFESLDRGSRSGADEIVPGAPLLLDDAHHDSFYSRQLPFSNSATDDDSEPPHHLKEHKSDSLISQQHVRPVLIRPSVPTIQPQLSSEESDNDEEDEEGNEYDHEYIEEQIEHVDNEIANHERLLATLRAKIAIEAANAAEEVSSATEKDQEMGQVNEAGSIGTVSRRKIPIEHRPYFSDFILDDIRARAVSHDSNESQSHESIIEKVLHDNQALSHEFKKRMFIRHKIVAGVMDFATKVTSSPASYDFYRDNIQRNDQIRPYIVNHVRNQMFAQMNLEANLRDEFEQLNESWMAKVERLEHAAKNDQGFAADGSRLGMGPGASNSITQGSTHVQMGRSTRRTGINSDVVRTEADWQNVLNQLNNTNEAEQRQLERSAKEPDMIISPELRTSTKFINNNGLVHDPAGNLAVFNNKMNMCWSDEERDILRVKLTQCGKNFSKISACLPHKSTANCIQYYYREKVNLRFKQLLRQCSVAGRGRRRKEKINLSIAPSFFKTYLLKANEEIVHVRTHSTWDSVCDVGGNESTADDDADANKTSGTIKSKKHRLLAIKDATSADVISHNIAISPTSQGQVNNQTQIQQPFQAEGVSSTSVSDTNWSEAEKAKALHAFDFVGRNFEAMASMVGTKTSEQCKAFYNNHRRKVGEEAVARESLEGFSHTSEASMQALPTKRKPKDLVSVSKKDKRKDLPNTFGKRKRSSDVSISDLNKESSPLNALNNTDMESDAPVGDDNATISHTGQGTDASRMNSAPFFLQNATKSSSVTDAPEKDGVLGIFSTTLVTEPANVDDQEKPKRKGSRKKTISSSTILLSGAPDRSNTPPLDAISAIAAAQADSTNPAEESEVIDEGVSPNREMLDNSNQHQALRKTVSYWSVNERSEFLKSMSKYGRNWDTISKGIGTKSAIQVRNYYHNYRLKLDFDKILVDNGHSVDDAILPIGKAVFMTETAAVEEAKESKIEAATKMGDATIACHGSSSNSNPISVLPSSSHPYSYFHPHEASQSHSQVQTPLPFAGHAHDWHTPPMKFLDSDSKPRQTHLHDHHTPSHTALSTSLSFTRSATHSISSPTELPPYGAMAIDSSIHNDAPHHFPPIPRSISPHKPTGMNFDHSGFTPHAAYTSIKTELNAPRHMDEYGSVTPTNHPVYHSAEHRVKQSAYAISSQVNAEDPLKRTTDGFFHAPISSSSSIGSYQGLENLPQHSHEHLTVVSSTDVGATVMHEHQHHNSVKETIYNESDNTKTGSSSTGWNLASTRSEQFCDTIPDQTLSNVAPTPPSHYHMHPCSLPDSQSPMSLPLQTTVHLPAQPTSLIPPLPSHFHLLATPFSDHLQHGQQRNVHSQPLSQLELVTDQSSGFVHNAMPHQPTSTASFGLADTSHVHTDAPLTTCVSELLNIQSHAPLCRSVSKPAEHSFIVPPPPARTFSQETTRHTVTIPSLHNIISDSVDDDNMDSLTSDYSYSELAGTKDYNAFRPKSNYSIPYESRSSTGVASVALMLSNEDSSIHHASQESIYTGYPSSVPATLESPSHVKIDPVQSSSKQIKDTRQESRVSSILVDEPS
ncbi:hypothetical protein BDV3_001384 [Batrachochytrium dendrobatidis]|nr:hypothetical protein BDEG_20914 [Batrachochytrium dendrobatidis JEL423]